MSAYKQHVAKVRREGYQEALQDLTNKLVETGDVRNLLQWIKDNAEEASVRNIISAYLVTNEGENE